MHSHALKVVYCLAILFKQMTSRFKENGSYLAKTDNPAEAEKRDIDTLIYGLVPTFRLTRKKELNEKIKKVTLETYEKLNIEESNTQNERDIPGGDLFVDPILHDIEQSEEDNEIDEELVAAQNLDFNNTRSQGAGCNRRPPFLNLLSSLHYRVPYKFLFIPKLR